jgi:hypothetical protein
LNIKIVRQSKKKAACTNCGSTEIRIHRNEKCKKCYYWHNKKRQLENVLAKTDLKLHRTKALSLQIEIRNAELALQEYAWREHRRRAVDVAPLDLESMFYTVAAECRSKIDFQLHPWLARMTPESRTGLFGALLSIVENVPARRPRAHLLHPR